jgi:hypothetical protein
MRDRALEQLSPRVGTLYVRFGRPSIPPRSCCARIRAMRSVNANANSSSKPFGWMKTVGGLRKLHHRGGRLVEWIVTFTAAVYNILRMRRPLVGAA